MYGSAKLFRVDASFRNHVATSVRSAKGPAPRSATCTFAPGVPSPRWIWLSAGRTLRSMPIAARAIDASLNRAPAAVASFFVLSSPTYSDGAFFRPAR